MQSSNFELLLCILRMLFEWLLIGSFTRERTTHRSVIQVAPVMRYTSSSTDDV